MEGCAGPTGGLRVWSVCLPFPGAAGLRLAATHATAVTEPAALNSSVQTASLQCFSIISKSCNFVASGQITKKSN